MTSWNWTYQQRRNTAVVITWRVSAGSQYTTLILSFVTSKVSIIKSPLNSCWTCSGTGSVNCQASKTSSRNVSIHPISLPEIVQANSPCVRKEFTLEFLGSIGTRICRVLVPILKRCQQRLVHRFVSSFCKVNILPAWAVLPLLYATKSLQNSLSVINRGWWSIEGTYRSTNESNRHQRDPTIFIKVFGECFAIWGGFVVTVEYSGDSF